MAHFSLELPTEIMKDFQEIHDNSHEIFERMTQAGAGVAKGNIERNMPNSFKKSNIRKNIKLTRPYVTPSDGGVNTKVAFYGYFVNKEGRTVPAPLVANVFEYGRSDFPKQPFMRKSFKKGDIEKAMLIAQKRASRGKLDE